MKYNPKGEQTGEIKQNMIKNKSTPIKQNENVSQNNEKIPNKLAAQRCGFLN